MRKFILLAFLTKLSVALTVVPVTETVCPSIVFTNTDSADTQDELNKKLQKKINAYPKATRLVSVNYTNTTTMIRDKDKACKTATAWVEVSN